MLLDRPQFLRLIGITSNAFSQMQHVGTVALAFGQTHPARPGLYAPLDAVAMAITSGLSVTFGRELASSIVRNFFDEWSEAVARADADPAGEFFLFIVSVPDDGTKAGRERAGYYISNGTTEEMFSRYGRLHGDVCAVNISDILRRLRERARKEGIDLSKPFYYLKNDPRFERMAELFKAIRKDSVAQKRKTAVASRTDIKALRNHASLFAKDR